MTEDEFEEKLLDLIADARTAGVSIDAIASALEMRIMALDEDDDG